MRVYSWALLLGESIALAPCTNAQSALSFFTGLSQPSLLRLRIQIWWMFTYRLEHATHVNESSTIEVESGDGRPASRRQTNNHREAIAPGEMLIPDIRARMKQRLK